MAKKEIRQYMVTMIVSFGDGQTSSSLLSGGRKRETIRYWQTLCPAATHAATPVRARNAAMTIFTGCRMAERKNVRVSR
jgi:hypothetical protein